MMTEKPTDHKIWEFFDALTHIPRISKHEQQVVEWVKKFGEDRNLETETDAVGNVIIRKPASKGWEDRKPVILQAHLDMVGAKDPDSGHDFLKDPVQWYREGNWIRARGTTLGADDGIGVAAALAILDDDTLQHGPLECLFTVDEESGMTGAHNLEGNRLRGKILINLDSEDEGELFIGCAGGIDTTAVFHKQTTSVAENARGYVLSINGLTGGHSGDEIHKGHANAIKLVNRFLWLADNKIGIQLARFEGGTLRNAIPPEAKAVFFINRNDADTLKNLFDDFRDIVGKEYKKTDPGLNLTLNDHDLLHPVLKDELQKKLLMSLYACPHGVYTWSQDIPGLVETSTNLALLSMPGGDKIIVGTSQRSAVASEKKDIADMVASVFFLAGARVEKSGGYPGWTPNPDSEILNITQSVYRKMFGKEPLVKAIHAGLECGLFLEKYPGLDMISFGPTIRGAHTPEERLDIESTVKFWTLLVQVLQHIPADN